MKSGIAIGAGAGLGIAVAGYALGGLQRPVHDILTWKPILIILAALVVQMLFVKYVKASTAGGETLRDVLSGVITGTALAFAFWA